MIQGGFRVLALGLRESYPALMGLRNAEQPAVYPYL